MDIKVDLEYKNALKTLPQHGIEQRYSKYLDNGNFGYVWLLKSGNVVKVTKDWCEYRTAQELKGFKYQYLVNIFDCWEVSNSLFIIIEERLYKTTANIDDQKKELFVMNFKHCWQKLNERLTHPTINFYWDLMMKCCQEDNRLQIGKAYSLFDNTESCYDMMFESTCSAIHELYKASPKALLDFNENNIMFTKNGQMKFIDLH